MKKYNLILSAIFGLSAIVSFTGCGKDGATGPQGPQGNANVVASEVTIPAGSWAYINNSTDENAAIQVPGLTSDIVANGTVLVYQVNAAVGETDYIALPYTYGNDQWGYTIVNSSNGNLLSFDYTLANLGVPPVLGDQTFKIIIIAGSIRKMHPEVDLNNYQQVKKVFSLKD